MRLGNTPNPNPPPKKILLAEPLHLFDVADYRNTDDERALGWQHIGPCKNLKASCCGSRAELRQPDGIVREVRIGGVSGWGLIITGPKPVGEIPIGTQVWLLEVEETDLTSSCS